MPPPRCRWARPSAAALGAPPRRGPASGWRRRLDAVTRRLLATGSRPGRGQSLPSARPRPGAVADTASRLPAQPTDPARPAVPTASGVLGPGPVPDRAPWRRVRGRPAAGPRWPARPGGADRRRCWVADRAQPRDPGPHGCSAALVARRWPTGTDRHGAPLDPCRLVTDGVRYAAAEAIAGALRRVSLSPAGTLRRPGTGSGMPAARRMGRLATGCVPGRPSARRPAPTILPRHPAGSPAGAVWPLCTRLRPTPCGGGAGQAGAALRLAALARPAAAPDHTRACAGRAGVRAAPSCARLFRLPNGDLVTRSASRAEPISGRSPAQLRPQLGGWISPPRSARA
jgi:hypothetical protein